MNRDLLLAHFDRVSEAPDALPRLRRFILDLAVRGKLVEQDPTDESASELLKRLQAEKGRLVKTGKIRNPRALETDGVEHELFPLPFGWAWCRLSEVGAVVGGGTPPSGDEDNFTSGGSGIAWLTPADLGKQPGLYVSHGARDLTPKGLCTSSATVMPKGTVLFTSRAPIGYTAIALNELSTNQGFKSVVPFISTCNLYIAVYFRAFGKWIDSKASGTTFREVSGKIVSSLFFPLPPLAEQQRIVAKVDELMALLDRLEVVRGERESRRDRLAAASHHYINNGANAEAFRQHAHFYLKHLPLLTIRGAHIHQLRQAILTLAVRGQLVYQDPSDEPASELLKRIQAEKERLAKKGSLKKDKMPWEGLAKYPPYKLPSAWIWTSLQDVFEISRGGSPRPAGDPRYFGGPIPWITVREITKDGEKYLTATETGLTEEGATRSRFIEPGDLLLTNSGATLGVPKISRIKACMNDGVAVLRQFHSFPLNDFAYLYLHSQTDSFRKVNQGMGQPNLNTPIIAGWFFPLPPLAEQQRIVAKVDELMQLCDRLETQLTTTQSKKRSLLEAVLHLALNDGAEVGIQP